MQRVLVRERAVPDQEEHPIQSRPAEMDVEVKDTELPEPKSALPRSPDVPDHLRGLLMIAYGDGKAGQWAKSQSHLKFRKLMAYLLSAAVFGGLLLGTGLGAVGFAIVVRAYPSVGHAHFLLFWTVVISIDILFTVTAVVTVSWLSRALDGISKERFRLLHGGMTEALVAHALNPLDDQWHLFNNIAMKGGGDIDHVLVGPGGLFSISTKSYRGLYTRDAAGYLLRNGQRAGHVAEAQQLAMKLRHWLEAKLDTIDIVKTIPYVQPVLAVPFMHVDFGATSDNVWVVDAQELLDLVLDSKPVLKSSQIQGCVSVLKELSGRQEWTSNRLVIR